MQRSKRPIAMLLVVSLLLSMLGFSGGALAAEQQRFTDVTPAHWAYEYVEEVAQRGLFSGTGDGSTFSPEADMTRAMFVTVLSRMDGGEAGTGGTAGFSDVASGAWYSGAVAWRRPAGSWRGPGTGPSRRSSPSPGSSWR